MVSSGALRNDGDEITGRREGRKTNLSRRSVEDEAGDNVGLFGGHGWVVLWLNRSDLEEGES